MTRLRDLAGEGAAENPSALNELRLNEEPAAIMTFTDDTEKVLVHYEKNQVRLLRRLPDQECPVCYLGSAPRQFALLPVLNIESGEVEVLRVSLRRGPGSLMDGLLPVLERSDLADLVILVRRNGARYSVSTQPLAAGASRHEQVVAAFQQALEQGLKLSSAFCAPSAAELAEADRIRRKLDAIGGYETPETDA